MPKKRTLLFLILLYFCIRLVILFFGFDSIYAYWELYTGTIAKDLINGHSLPFWGYEAGNHEYGRIVMAFFAVPLFLLFGDSYLILKIVPLCTSLVILVILYLLLFKFFNQRIAVITCLFFILSPPAFTVLSMLSFGSHFESIFFSLVAIYIFYEIFVFNKSKSVYFIYLALISGLAVILTPIFLITLITCFLCWFIVDRRFFFKKNFQIFIIYFFVSLIPLIYYNLKFPFFDLGLGPLDNRHFMKNSLVFSLNKFKNFVSYDLVNGFCFNNLFFLGKEVISYFYYLIFLVSYIGLLVFVLRSKKAPFRLKEIFILLFPLVFTLAFSFSNYRLGSGPYNNRYLSPLLLFMFMIIAIFLDRMLESHRPIIPKIGKLLLITLISIGLLTNLNLISLENFGEGTVYNGFSYCFLGLPLTMFAGDNVIEGINSIMEEVPLEHRAQGFKGLGIGVILYDRYVKKLNDRDFRNFVNIAKQIDTQYRNSFIEGVVMFFPVEDLRLAINLANTSKIDPFFLNSFYQGIGHKMYVDFEDDIDSIVTQIDSLDKTYRFSSYIGLTKEFAFVFLPDIKRCIELINRVPMSYRRHCYNGLGYGIGIHCRLNNVKTYIENINMMIEEKYKRDCYGGFIEAIYSRVGSQKSRLEDILIKVPEKYRDSIYFVS
jgi:hypothetical protein